MRPSKLPDIEEVLSFRKEGWLRIELMDTWGFSKSTLHRHLEPLVAKGLVIKEKLESKGRVGRPATRYRFADNVDLAIRYPVKWAANVWFPCRLRKGKLKKGRVPVLPGPTQMIMPNGTKRPYSAVAEYKRLKKRERLEEP